MNTPFNDIPHRSADPRSGYYSYLTLWLAFPDDIVVDVFCYCGRLLVLSINFSEINSIFPIKFVNL